MPASEKPSSANRVRREYFIMENECRAINKAIYAQIQTTRSQNTNSILPEENTLHYTHGRKWSNRANPNSLDGGFQEHSTEWETSFQDIVDGDLSIIPAFVQHLTTEMHRQMATMVYSSLEVATKSTGNVVSAQQEGGFPAAFLEMLKKIEFGVDKKGNVSLPQLHVGTNAQKLIAELEAQPPEFQAEVERIKAEKSAAALAAEAARKKKFKSGPEEK